MDIRVLRYFLTVAKEQSINKAAQTLHMTQPPLSRQMQELEEELGKKLFIRGNRKILLTEEGMLLRKRAEEIVELFEKTEAEVRAASDTVSGEIYIGAAETKSFGLVAKSAKRLREQFPDVRYHLCSGNSEDTTERLDRGLLDFAVLSLPADIEKYKSLVLPAKDHWGVLLRRDHPLASKKGIAPQDLRDIPVILSRQAIGHKAITSWMQDANFSLQVVSTYNLLYNASIMAEADIGCVLCLQGIIPEYSESSLCFVPLEPPVEAGLALVWKKEQPLSKAALKLLEIINNKIAAE